MFDVVLKRVYYKDLESLEQLCNIHTIQGRYMEGVYHTHEKVALCVGDSHFLQNAVAAMLQDKGFKMDLVGSQSSEIAAGVRLSPTIVIIDFDMVYNDPYLIASILHDTLPESYIVLMNGHIHHCSEIEAKKAGVSKILDRHYHHHEWEELLIQLEHVPA